MLRETTTRQRKKEINGLARGSYWHRRWPVHGTRVECQSLPTTRTIVTDKTMSGRVILRRRLLRHSNLCAKHESCIQLLLPASEDKVLTA
jgi:hypothetical protein